MIHRSVSFRSLVFSLLLLLPVSWATANAQARDGQTPRPGDPQAATESIATPGTARIEAIRAMAARATARLEALRGKKFKHPVPVVLQDEADFRAYVDRELRAQLPPELAEKESIALQAFGLLPPGYDLRKGLEDLYVSQAGAYYDPDADTFYVLRSNLPDAQLEVLLIHELAHALQDQYFDLGAMRDAALASANEDRRATLPYLYEGEASYLMTMDYLTREDNGSHPLSLEKREAFFQSLRVLSRERLMTNALSSQPPGPDGDDVRRAVEALSSVPGYLFWGLQEPYLKGQYCIHRVQAAQGWAGVDALFQNPPTSTEQVLHPEKLVPPREEPRQVTLPDLAQRLDPPWTEVFRNTLGEAGVLVFFDEHNRGVKVQAAAGWGGDQYVVLRHPEQGLLLVWRTVWDTPQDATEFEQALGAVAPERLCAGRSGTVRAVRRHGTQVLLVAGPRQATALALTALESGE